MDVPDGSSAEYIAAAIQQRDSVWDEPMKCASHKIVDEIPADRAQRDSWVISGNKVIVTI